MCQKYYYARNTTMTKILLISLYQNKPYCEAPPFLFFWRNDSQWLFGFKSLKTQSNTPNECAVI
jgi:hypothetical protein